MKKNVKLYLTNNRAFRMTNKYISKFNLINQTFDVNLKKKYHEDICNNKRKEFTCG